MDAICEHLEAQTYGQIKNLIINIPPRFTKSLIASVFWPCWEWTFAPWLRYLCCSYHDRLSVRDTNRARNLIASNWYQRRWPIQLALDQNAKSRFANNKNGERIAISARGMVTGEGGDRIIVDDPHNVKESESDVIREATIDWWRDSMTSRLNDASKGTKTIIMQRVHQFDLTGWIRENASDDWEFLCLPNEFESERRCVTSLGFTDPRKAEGELLCESRLGPKEIKELKSNMTDVAYASQYQQRPAPKGGSLFKREWFRYFGRRGDYYVLNPNENETVINPSHIKTVFLTADTAATEKEYSDYTVIAAWAVTKTFDLLLLDVLRQKMEVPKIKPAILNMASLHSTSMIGIEERGSGQGLAQDLRRTTPLSIFPLKADKSKVDRSQIAQIRMAAGQVYFPLDARKTWLPKFQQELLEFTPALTHAHDDQVDNLSYACILVAKMHKNSKIGMPGAV